MAIFLCSIGRLLLVVRNTLIFIPACAFAFEYDSDDYTTINFSPSSQYCVAEVGSSCSYDIASGHVVIQEWQGAPYTSNNSEYFRRYYKSCPEVSSGFYLSGTDGTSPTSSNASKCWYSSEPPPDPCPDDVSPVREYGCMGGLAVGTEGNYPVCSNAIPSTVCRSGCLFTGPSQVIGTPDSPYPGTSYYPDSTWIYQPAGSECTDSPQDGEKHIPDGFESDGSGNLDGFDGDGDGTPDEDDLDPNDPLIGGDTDGGGTADHEDPDPNDPAVGGSTDPGGFGDGSGGEFGSGMCTPATRSEPTCKPHMDVINCGIFLEQWNTRCDSKLFHAEIIGTDQYRAGNDLDDAEGEGVPEASFNAGSVITGLSETTISWGGGSCPNDRSFEMPGAFGGTFSLSYQPICDFAVMVRPVVIALGYMISALIILRKFSGSGSDD